MIEFHEIKDMLEERKLNHFYAGNAIEGTAKILIPCDDKRYCCCMSFTKDMSKDQAMVLNKIGYEEVNYDAEFGYYIQRMLSGNDNIMSGYVSRVYGGDNLHININHIIGESDE